MNKQAKRKYFSTTIYSFIVMHACFIFSSCTNSNVKEVTRGVYFWKSSFRVSAFENERLSQLHVETIFLKVFDVGWDSSSNSAVPIAKVELKDIETLKKKRVVPVVFITNECIFKLPESQLPSTGLKIHNLVTGMLRLNDLGVAKEIQIDCDWTAQTKEKYFALLNQLQAIDTSIVFSATIRLHQVKFLAKTGVPPVKKGLLMCYNMGNLKNPATRNSIIELEELKKYAGSLWEYPLPLDVGLPIFEWMVLFRNGNYTGLVSELSAELLNHPGIIRDGNRYRFQRDTILSGYNFRTGDLLRYEQSEYSTLIKTAGWISERLNNQKPMVLLYHLDSLTLSKYSPNELENIYNGFR